MEFCVCPILSVIGILIVLKVYLKLSTRWCQSNGCLIGKTAIITGANKGIGYEAAADFAKRGARVILACRDETRGQNARDKIIQETDNVNIIFRKLDLASLDSVREFAKEISNTEERLDILVNNAGVGSLGSQKSKDGLLMTMQINYFGHFLLTNLLLDLIKKTPNSRIINLSSIMAALPCGFNVNKLNEPVTTRLQDSKIYSRSKLCNILFTIELANRLKGTTVTTYSVHPGIVLTEIYDSMPFYTDYLITPILRYYSQNRLEGTQTTIYCSVEKGIEHQSGLHFDNCRVVRRYKNAQDPSLPGKLWKISEQLVNLN